MNVIVSQMAAGHVLRMFHCYSTRFSASMLTVKTEIVETRAPHA